MEDKLTNLLIGLIFIVVLILGGMYVYKIIIEKPKPVIAQSNENFNVISTIESTKTIESNIGSKVESSISSNVKIPLVESKETRIEQTVIETPQTQEKMVYYNNRYYYNQLDTYSKVIYDAIFNNIENLKQGNYKINIDYDFSKLLGKDSDNKIINNYFNDAMNALNLDLSNLFYIDFSKMSMSIESTTTILGTKYQLYINAGQNPNYYVSGFNSKEQIDNIISNLLHIKNQIINTAVGNDYNKITLMHDWLIEYLQYDSSSENKSTIYGAFIKKKAVCEGYARTYKYILDELGIDNILIVGTATNSSGETEEHMWNYVKLNNIWYAIDCTWDDPILVNGTGVVSYAAKHKYFMIGSDKLFLTHVEKSSISASGKTFTLPILSKTDY